MNRTSSTSQSFDGPWTYTSRKHTRKERLAGWYMVHVAGRYCPCQWPIKSRRLIRLCGRIDDYFCDRAKLLDFAHFYTQMYAQPSVKDGGE